MMAPEKLRIATTTGLIHWVLIVHFAAGLTGLFTGFVALAFSKGSRLHRSAGRLFVYAMVTMGFLAAGIAAYGGSMSPLGGFFAAYLVLTGMTTVRPLQHEPQGWKLGLGLFALTFGVLSIIDGLQVMGSPTGTKGGVPFGMLLFLGTIGLLAGAGDLRMVRVGGLEGTRRLARHLWRMCFGLFFASGSFFLGQMQFVPEPIRIFWLLMVAALLPLAALVYWLWRVRLRPKGFRHYAEGKAFLNGS